MTRLHLILGYDGRPFSGWQSQPVKNGIQDHLEKAFSTILGKRVVVHGSGRTDAGVHACGQSAHADVPADHLATDRWRAALNAHLPPEIRVKQIRVVSEKFHARFSAKSKQYRYRIFNESWLDPLEIGRAWHVPGALDVTAMNEVAIILTGRHDFRAFAANRGKPEETTIRDVWKIALRKQGPVITLTFEGEGFLYKMVRMLAAILVRAGQGKISTGEIRRLLTDPSAKKSSHTAPAEGLYLVGVGY
ncbi:MAG TPA: tRNA pseudouridine(38-40) synthase TruA [Chthoniobacterales bacterium]